MGKTAGYIFARKQPKDISTLVTSSRFLDIVYKLYKFEEFLFLVPVANFRIYVTLLTMTPRYPRLHIEHVIHLQFHLVQWFQR
jgi:hypothetical protein